MQSDPLFAQAVRSWHQSLAEVFKAENEARRTLIQLLGGLFFFAGLVFTWLQLQATQDRQITDRFSKAIEHLGDETLAVRLGGIYALERIARDSERDHWTTMEVLTAYVRGNSPRALRVNVQTGEIERYSVLTTPGVKPDIQTILTVIGRRNTAHEQGQEYTLDLSGTYLITADLSGADFRGADLTRADLTRANLRGARNLTKKQLQVAITEISIYWCVFFPASPCGWTPTTALYKTRLFARVYLKS